jgi:hypothetical protein
MRRMTGELLRIGFPFPVGFVPRRFVYARGFLGLGFVVDVVYVLLLACLNKVAALRFRFASLVLNLELFMTVLQTLLLLLL